MRGDRRGERLERGLYRTWYLTGAVWTAGWLGLGTAYLLGRTRFGYSFAACLFLAGLFTFLLRNKPEYQGAGTLPLLYFIVAGLLALAVAVETYFANHRWPVLAAAAVVGATVLSLVLMLATTLPAPGYAVDPLTGAPIATLLPPSLRLLTPFLNITGAFALILGAVFSTYVFMPKRRVLDYSLDPNQPGDEFLFNLVIAPVAIIVNLVASLPGAARALVAGKLHSRVPATILIAIGAFVATLGDTLTRFGMTDWFSSGQVPRRAVPVRRVPRVDRGLPRDPDPVHLDPPGANPARTGRCGTAGRRRRVGGRTRPRSRLGGPDLAPRRVAPAEAAPVGAGSRHTLRRWRPTGPTMAPMPAPDRPPVAGFAIVITAASLFGMLGPLSRFAYDAGMEPLPFVAWRGGIGLLAAGAFVAWRISRGAERLTRLADLDREARLTLAGGGPARVLAQPRDVHRVRPRDRGPRAARLLHLPGHRGGRQRRARARAPGPVAGSSPSSWRSAGWSRSWPPSSIRRPGSASTPSGSGSPWRRRSARPPSS